MSRGVRVRPLIIEMFGATSHNGHDSAGSVTPSAADPDAPDRRFGGLALNVAVIRDAELPLDRAAVTRLWLDYLNWGNDGLHARYGFRLPVQEAVERDLASIGKFAPPDGRLLLAVEDGEAVGTAALQRIGTSTAEIKRMWVAPACRRSGIGGGVFDRLIAAAEPLGMGHCGLTARCS